MNRFSDNPPPWSGDSDRRERIEQDWADYQHDLAAEEPQDSQPETNKTAK